MITATGDNYSLRPQLNWEESDLILGNALTRENVLKILERMEEIKDTIVGADLVSTVEDQHRITFLKGKLNAFQELLDDDKEAKTKQHIGQ